MAAALLIAAGCAHSPSLSGSFTTIGNGGIALGQGSCSELTISDVSGQLAPYSAGLAGCAEAPGFLTADTATFALWQIADSQLAGPIASNRVELHLHQLGGGESSVGLSAGENRKALASGEDRKALAAATAEVALGSGHSQKGLAAGEDHAALAAAQTTRSLSSGEDRAALSAGASQKSMASGEDRHALAAAVETRSLAAGQATRPVLALQKFANPTEVGVGDEVTFTLEVRNTGEVPLSKVVVIDRLSAKLQLLHAAAQSWKLPQGGTVLAFELTGPIEPGDSRQVSFTVEIKP